MILLVAYGGGHVAMLAPIAQTLTAQGRPFIFLALTTAKSVLDRLGIPSIGFRDLPEATDSDAQRWGIELAGDLPVGGAVSSKETIAYLGASFRDLVYEHGELDARRRYSETKRQAFLPVATMRRFIERISPDLVVATNSPRAERAAILAAGQLGIPSVCVVDLFAIQEVQWIGQPGYATRVCVLNDSVRDRLLAHGRDAHEIAVTGNPAFDQLRAPENIQAGAQLRRERGWDDGKKIILWASQIEPLKHPFVDLLGDPTLPCRVEEYLREIVTADENLRLVVRYHPSERNVFNRANRVDFSPLSEPIATLLHAVDVVVVTASTVGLEAALSGRPVISVDLSVFTPDTQYASMGISTGVTDLSELKMALNKSFASVAPVMMRGQSSNSSAKNVLQIINTLLIQ